MGSNSLNSCLCYLFVLVAHFLNDYWTLITQLHVNQMGMLGEIRCLDFFGWGFIKMFS